MNSNTTNKSTKELKAQILNDIQKVKDDFAEIKSRMTPGQLIDDAIFYRRGDTNPQMTFDHLKRNPVGTTFLTLGTLLLMEDETHVSYEGMVRSRAGVYKDRVGGVMTSARDKIDVARDKINGAKEKISSVQGSIKSKFSKDESSSFATGTSYDSSYTGVEYDESGASKLDAARDALNEKKESVMSSAREGIQGAKSTISSATDSVKSKAQSGLESARSTLSSATDSVKNRSQEVYESAKHLDPLTYLALGAGLGTLTGAAFPVSYAEERTVDQAFEDKMVEFRRELEVAFNQSANILKNEFIGGLTNINMSIF